MIVKPIESHELQDFSPLLDDWERTLDKSQFRLKLDKDCVMFSLAHLIRSDHCVVLGLRGDKGRLLGFMGIVIIPSPLDNKPIANEHFFFVDPRHRGPGGVKLIREAESWSKRYGCRALLLTASKLASIRHDRVERLYVRLQYKPFEATYIKEF
jgi:GNAT superfamily N-acetyltransferase